MSDRDRVAAVALAREVDGRRGGRARSGSTPRGVGGDRTHAVLHEHKGEWRPLTAREAPRHARLVGRPTRSTSTRGWTRPSPPYAIVAQPDGRHTYQWGDPLLRRALEQDLGRPVRFQRDVAGMPDVPGQILLTVEGTLRALSEELGAEVDVRRFRPNLHLELDSPPWAEERWAGAMVEIEGGVRLRDRRPVRALRDPDARPGHPREVARAAAPPHRRARPELRRARPRDRRRARRRGRASSRADRLSFRFSGEPPIRVSPDPHPEEEVLRIDETSKTLVAPQAGGLVTEASPDREELLALVGASWEAFAQELGFPTLRLLATEPLPGVDMLAFDPQAGRAVVVQVTGETVEWQLIRALQAAAAVAGDGRRRSWPACTRPSRPPCPATRRRSCMIAGAFDPSALETAGWLSRRHGVEISTFAVNGHALRQRAPAVRAPRAARRPRPRTPPPRSSGC